VGTLLAVGDLEGARLASATLHLDVAGMLTSLWYRQRRVDCPRCGVVVEMVPWAGTCSWFTHDFEQTAAEESRQGGHELCSGMTPWCS
jgi:transposase